MTNKLGDQTKIREILNDHIEALRTKNADLLMSHNSADFVSCSLAPPLRLSGKAANGKASIHAWFATWKTPIVTENHDVAVEVGGDIAFAHGLTHMSGTKIDGEEVSLWFRNTSCFRRSGGKWQIVHSHDSVPFYMDGSYRAAMDLES